MPRMDARLHLLKSQVLNDRFKGEHMMKEFKKDKLTVKVMATRMEMGRVAAR